MFKLSICIPTYNRGEFLAETLESILPQMTEGVEVVVNDNASTDYTAAVVEGLQTRFPRLVYFRQPENVGQNKTCLQAVTSARGEYCWLLGDDGLLEEGSVSALLNEHLTGERRPDFVLLTGTVYDSQMKRIVAHSADQISVEGDVYTNDVRRLSEKSFCESGLSVFVVHREKWNAVDPRKYIGTGLVYLAVVYEYLELDSPVQVVWKPSIKYWSGNASWSNSTLEIVAGYMSRMMDLLPERYDSAKPATMARYRQYVPVTLRMMVSLRTVGHYDRRLYAKYVADYFQDQPSTRLAATLVAVLPSPLLRGIKAAVGK